MSPEFAIDGATPADAKQNLGAVMEQITDHETRVAAANGLSEGSSAEVADVGTTPSSDPETTFKEGKAPIEGEDRVKKQALAVVVAENFEATAGEPAVEGRTAIILAPEFSRAAQDINQTDLVNNLLGYIRVETEVFLANIVTTKEETLPKARTKILGYLNELEARGLKAATAAMQSRRSQFAKKRSEAAQRETARLERSHSEASLMLKGYLDYSYELLINREDSRQDSFYEDLSSEFSETAQRHADRISIASDLGNKLDWKTEKALIDKDFDGFRERLEKGPENRPLDEEEGFGLKEFREGVENIEARVNPRSFQIEMPLTMLIAGSVQAAALQLTASSLGEIDTAENSANAPPPPPVDEANDRKDPAGAPPPPPVDEANDRKDPAGAPPPPPVDEARDRKDPAGAPPPPPAPDDAAVLARVAAERLIAVVDTAALPSLTEIDRKQHGSDEKAFKAWYEYFYANIAKLVEVGSVLSIFPDKGSMIKRFASNGSFKWEIKATERGYPLVVLELQCSGSTHTTALYHGSKLPTIFDHSRKFPLTPKGMLAVGAVLTRGVCGVLEGEHKPIPPGMAAEAKYIIEAFKL